MSTLHHLPPTPSSLCVSHTSLPPFPVAPSPLNVQSFLPVEALPVLLPVLLHVVMLRLWLCEEEGEAGRMRRMKMIHARWTQLLRRLGGLTICTPPQATTLSPS